MKHVGQIFFVILVCALLTGLVWFVYQPVSETKLKLSRTWASPTTSSLSCANLGPTQLKGALDASGKVQSPVKVNAGLEAVSLPRNGQPISSAHYKTLKDEQIPLSASPSGLSLTLPKASAGFLESEGSSSTPALSAGVVYQGVNNGDYQGLAVAPCALASHLSFLVGGSTKIESSTVLELSNPSPRPVQVEVSVFGPLGKIEIPALEHINIAPWERNEFALESLVADLDRLVLRVQANGNGIVAGLRLHEMQGFNPAGIDYISPGAKANTQVYIPGLDTKYKSWLRVLSLGEKPAGIKIELLDEKGGKTLVLDQNLMLDPQSVFDIPLESLPAGQYGIKLSSTQALVAGLRLETKEENGQNGRDLAWLPSASQQNNAVVLSPKNLKTLLLVTNSSEETSQIKVGEKNESIGANASRSFELNPSTTTLVELNNNFATLYYEQKTQGGIGIAGASPSPDVVSRNSIALVW